MRSFLLILSLIFIVSCSKKEDSSSAEDAISDVCETQIFGPCIDPISNFSYGANQLILTKGQNPIFLVPSYIATADVEFYPSISLPEGLVINRDTGVISGSPLQIQEEKSYAIIIRYSDDNIRQQFNARGDGGGLKTFSIKIKILDIPPSNIVLGNNDISVARRDNIPDITVTSVEGGSVLSYEVTPNLPEGLFLDTETGTISGSPVFEQQRTSYLLTAKNSGGQDSVNFYIEVTGRPPENLNYLDNVSSYLAGESLYRDNLPIYSGDTASSYEINPQLPKGMTFDTNSGVISGNPSEIVTDSEFQIKAINDWGEAVTNITISTLDNITDISTGLNHTCVIKNKKVNCSGRNEFSQLGRISSDMCLDDNSDSYPCEKTFDFVNNNGEPLEAIKIVSTRSSNCVLSEDTRVYCWGDNLFGQLGSNNLNSNNIQPEAVVIDIEGTKLNNVVEIDAGNLHVCARTNIGKVYCWGDNRVSQQGSLIFTQIDYAKEILDDIGNPISGIDKIALGYNHTCYIKDMKVKCVGDNSLGVLGLGNTDPSSEFKEVIDLSSNILSGISDVFLGRSYSLAFVEGQGLFSWGTNDNGQLATDNTSPRTKAGITNPIINSNKIYKGEDSFCFIKDDLKGYCVGQNDFNFGRPTVTGINTSPVAIFNEAGDGEMNDITLISKGYSRHRCLARTGRLYCFGKNIMGQLGDGSISDSLLPKEIVVNQ